MGFSKSISVITIINILGALLGVVHISVIAYFYGTSRELEVYFAAVQLFMLLSTLAQAGKLGDIFLPIFHNIKHSENLLQAYRAFSVILNWMLAFIVILSVILYFCAGILIGVLVPGFSAEDQYLGERMFIWIIPLLGLQLFSALAATLANAESRFARPEVISVLAKLGTLASIIGFAGILDVWALVVGLWVSTIVQLIGFIWILHEMGYRHSWKFIQMGFSHWQVFRNLIFTLVYVLTAQIYVTVLNAALSYLPQGYYAIFKYMQQLYAKTNSIFLRPVSIVFFTHFSEALAKGALDMRMLVRKALARALAIIAIVLVCVIVAGRPLLGMLLGEQSFGSENLDLAIRLLIIFYSLLFLSQLEQIGRKIGLTFQLIRTLYLFASVVQIFSAVITWYLVDWYGIYGAMGAIATNTIFMALVPYLVLMHSNKKFIVGYQMGLLLKWFASGATGVLCTFIFADYFNVDLPELNRIYEAFWGMTLVAVAMITMALAAFIFRIPEAVLARNILKNLVKR